MKTPPDWTTLQVGDNLPPITLPALTRHTLALYCGASGDHNPIHVDTDFARAAGLPDVFAHGMLSAAWLARVLTGWAPQSALRSLDVRFAALTQVGDRITCSANVIENSAQHLRVALHSADQNGAIKLSAEALLHKI